VLIVSVEPIIPNVIKLSVIISSVTTPNFFNGFRSTFFLQLTTEAWLQRWPRRLWPNPWPPSKTSPRCRPLWTFSWGTTRSSRNTWKRRETKTSELSLKEAVGQVTSRVQAETKFLSSFFHLQIFFANTSAASIVPTHRHLIDLLALATLWKQKP